MVKEKKLYLTQMSFDIIGTKAVIDMGEVFQYCEGLHFLDIITIKPNIVSLIISQ